MTLDENTPTSNYLIGLFDGCYYPGDKFIPIYLRAISIVLSKLANEVNNEGRTPLVPQAVKVFSKVLADFISKVECFRRYREISDDIYLPINQGFFIQYQIGPGSRSLLECNRFFSQKRFDVAVFRAKKRGIKPPSLHSLRTFLAWPLSA